MSQDKKDLVQRVSAMLLGRVDAGGESRSDDDAIG